MKKLFLVLSTLFISVISYSQIVFEKGYFIKNSGEKIECFIRNSDWNTNPDKFSYKLNDNGENVNIALIDSVKIFEIYGYAKYERHKVNFDKSRFSGTSIDNLSSDSQPAFESKMLFLKLLVEGDANLYLYRKENINMFFYSIKPSEELVPLVYKKYMINGQIAENKSYAWQLRKEVLSESTSGIDFQRLKYDNKDLTNYFLKYNTDAGYSYAQKTEIKKRNWFQLNVRPGVRYSSLEVSSRSWKFPLDFGSNVNVRAGLEAEFILPINKNKWALIVEAAYQSFNSKVDKINYSIDYKSLDIPFGVRYYIFLSDKSKLFVSAQWSIDLAFNSKYCMEGESFKLGTGSRGSLIFAAGYKYKRFGVEARFDITSKDVFENYIFYSSSYRGMSLNLVYTLF